MIEVIYCPEEFLVQITGHAGSAPKGQDLLCAAVSGLALTLAENIKHMAKSQWFTEYTVELSEGKAYIHCRPKPKARTSVNAIFDSVCYGLNILAHLWPEYLSYYYVSTREPKQLHQMD